MKKYLYVGVLVGTIMLVGCNVNEENAKQVEEEKEEIPNTNLSEEDQLKSDSEKVVEKPKAILNLSQEQKEAYYKEYANLLEKVNSEYVTNLETEPINKFSSVDKITNVHLVNNPIRNGKYQQTRLLGQ